MATVEASIEGIIEIAPAPDGAGGVNIQVMGVTIHFAPGITASGRLKTIKTPTQRLTVGEFLSAVAFPGRTEAGFIGATVIADGTYDTTTKVLEADFLDVQPAEMVLLGALTTATAGPPVNLAINGCPVVMLTDPRLSSNPSSPLNPQYLNQYGFVMKIASALIADKEVDQPPPPSSAEGYYVNGQFHAFRFEYGGTGVLVQDPRTVPQISFKSASLVVDKNGGRLNAVGFVTTAHEGTDAKEQNLGVYFVTYDAAGAELETLVMPKDLGFDEREKGILRWTFEARKIPMGSEIPEFIRVKNLSSINIATATTAPKITEK